MNNKKEQQECRHQNIKWYHHGGVLVCTDCKVLIEDDPKDQEAKTLQESLMSYEYFGCTEDYWKSDGKKMAEKQIKSFLKSDDASQFKSQSIQEWNEVTNVNPEPSVWVACLSISNSGFINWVSKGRMNNSKTWNIKGSVGMSLENATPTHWMPLPGPPK